MGEELAEARCDAVGSGASLPSVPTTYLSLMGAAALQRQREISSSKPVDCKDY